MVIKSYTVIAKDPTRNMAGKVMIPNPSIVTVEMGDVNLQIKVDGEHMGTGEIPGLVLKPGNHLYDFNALIGEDNIATVAMVALSNGELSIGSNGTYIDGERIAWLSSPLMKLESQVPVQPDEKEKE